ncbi:dihydrofolate reductase family protein [Sulfuriroseicoccus oceanibius]|uniref:Dihydrofolate reductase n=1 Tax=Sulfuriroseicoccus oceanibius TaxID=2707525 RepID=A0A6B3L6K4_9BACT|nr:dihydrofolate reductase family protein [Sulfuriroseicoccus oceanibius]QQL44787.1 dihydrofolate reductase [Sulfuriroseicoccus oceanibius]
MQCSVFIATSLDGFIARSDGDIDWLMDADTSDPPEDTGYFSFIETIDCLVMGRNSLEKVLTFPEWPYEGRRVVVMSRSMRDVPSQVTGKFEYFNGSPEELVTKLNTEGCHRLYIDGGQVIQSFLRAGLITDLCITTIPILLGDGIPLFGPLEKDVKLRHVSTKTFQSGFVETNYQVVK